MSSKNAPSSLYLYNGVRSTGPLFVLEGKPWRNWASVEGGPIMKSLEQWSFLVCPASHPSPYAPTYLSPCHNEGSKPLSGCSWRRAFSITSPLRNPNFSSAFLQQKWGGARGGSAIIQVQGSRMLLLRGISKSRNVRSFKSVTGYNTNRQNLELHNNRRKN